MKRVVLGVSGSVAAYKAADLASRLVKSGVEVFPILTPGAARFVQPATFRALTHNPCPVTLDEEPFPGEIAHIYLARHCDLFAIVPASMNVIARLANGLADDMLSAAAMATPAPILLAPGMNTGMWNHPATQNNLAKLRDYGCFFIEPVTGRLACRTEGVGRMADVDTIFAAIHEMLQRGQAWAGVKVLVTAGPTREPVDPVRFLSNRSSGKMGYAIAEAAQARGASVTLITGPTALAAPGGMEVVRITTAAEMHDAMLSRAADMDVIIASAAVADFRPVHVSQVKIKKAPPAPQSWGEETTDSGSVLHGPQGQEQSMENSLALPPAKIGGPGGPLSLSLEPTADILAALGQRKPPGQTLVGFAAETDNVLGNARAKLRAKHLDWIVANDVGAEGAGFDGDTNIITLLGADGQEMALPLLTKREVAERILDSIRSE